MAENATPVERSEPAPKKASPPHVWQAGEILADRYRLLELLGEGAMGAVWAGEHVHMRKKFALKILHPEAVASQELVARFEREAVAAGNINHPGVAAATDFGQLPDGSFFLVLEYVAGKDLRHLVHEGALPVARALDITKQILQALGAAHAKGVVHRDVKPENVMLLVRDDAHASGMHPPASAHPAPRRDVVKILDFGIAKMDGASFGGGAEGEALTRMGSIYGTPNYMAPEQALGTPVDARADLYAVGVMLYEMLSGKPPFDGDPITVIAKHVNDPPPPLHSPRGDAALTTEVRALVDGMLAKDRDARPADAEAAVALLDAAVASLPEDRQATVLGDTLTASPKPPWAHEKPATDRVRVALEPWAHKLGVKVEHLFYALVGAGALLLILIVWLVARPSRTTLEVDTPARKRIGEGASATATPSASLTIVPAATSTTASASPAATSAPAPVATSTGGGGGGGGAGGAATTGKSSGGGGGGPIKKSGGGNSLVNKLKSVFK